MREGVITNTVPPQLTVYLHNFTTLSSFCLDTIETCTVRGASPETYCLVSRETSAHSSIYATCFQHPQALFKQRINYFSDSFIIYRSILKVKLFKYLTTSLLWVIIDNSILINLRGSK